MVPTLQIQSLLPCSPVVQELVSLESGVYLIGASTGLGVEFCSWTGIGLIGLSVELE